MRAAAKRLVNLPRTKRNDKRQPTVFLLLMCITVRVFFAFDVHDVDCLKMSQFLCSWIRVFSDDKAIVRAA